MPPGCGYVPDPSPVFENSISRRISEGERMQKESFLKSTKPLPGLLEHIAQELGADFAYLYRLAESSGSAELVARTGVAAPPAPERHAHGAIPPDSRLVIAASAWS